MRRLWICCAAIASVTGCLDRTPSLVGTEVKVSGPSYAEVLGPVLAQESPPPYLGAEAPWAALKAFYAGRASEPLWIDREGIGRKGQQLLEALCNLHRDGLDPSAYRSAELNSRIDALGDGAAPSATLIELELLLGKAYLEAASDLATGRMSPRRGGSFTREPPFDPAAALKLAAEKNADHALDAHRPAREEYRGLVEALAEYRELAGKGGWPTIDKGPMLEPGKRDPRVLQLRARLRATGELDGDDPKDPELFDEKLVEAVKAFQRRHGLEEDAKVAGKTLAALRVPIQKRIQQLQANLERWRWLPRDTGDRYVLVNAAGFELKAFEGGDVKLRMRTITGLPDWPTPAFSGTVEALTVNPEWVIPERILRDEIVPAMRDDPEYATKNGMAIHDREADVELSQEVVDWEAEDLDHLRVRQPAGPGNPLGKLKFEMSNPFAIYLHDTNAKKLFNKADRALSHGCIRVEDPIGLARWLSHGSPETHYTLDGMLEQRKTRRLNLEKPVPVHIAYFTAWREADGSIQLRSDLYSRDRRVVEGLGLAKEEGVGGSGSACR